MAFAGRQTAGRGATAIQGSKWASADGVVGRTLFRTSGALANASYDARNTSVVQKNAGRLGMSGAMGTGGKLGFQGVIDAQAKDKSMRTNFVNNYKKKEENRVRESFNALSENAPDERKKFLANLKGSSKESDKELGKKIEEEETRKAFNVYKNLGEKGTIQGDKEHAEFEAKHKDETELKARVEEYEKKKEDKKNEDKADKDGAKQERKDATSAMKSLAEALQSSKGKPGETSPITTETKTNSLDSNKNILGRSPEEVAKLTTGYELSPGGIAVPVNMKTSTQTIPTTSSFDVRNIDLSEVRRVPSSSNKQEGSTAETTNRTGAQVVNHKEEELTF